MFAIMVKLRTHFCLYHTQIKVAQIWGTQYASTMRFRANHKTVGFEYLSSQWIYKPVGACVGSRKTESEQNMWKLAWFVNRHTQRSSMLVSSTIPGGRFRLWRGRTRTWHWPIYTPSIQVPVPLTTNVLYSTSSSKPPYHTNSQLLV